MAVAYLAPVVNQNQCLAQCILHRLAQLALAYLKQALIARTDLQTLATLATHDSQSLSVNFDDSIPHTHHLARFESHHNINIQPNFSYKLNF